MICKFRVGRLSDNQADIQKLIRDADVRGMKDEHIQGQSTSTPYHWPHGSPNYPDILSLTFHHTLFHLRF